MKKQSKAPESAPPAPQRSASRPLMWTGIAILLAGGTAWMVYARNAPVGEKSAGDDVIRTESEFQPTVENKTPAPGTAPEGMAWIPGGEFSMGSTVKCEGMCSLGGVTRDA